MATSTPGGDGASDTKRGMATSTPGGTSDTKISIAASTPGGDEGTSDTKRSRLAALHRKHAAAVAATTTPSPSKQPPPSSSSPASFRIFKTDPNDLNYAKLCPSVFNGPLVSQLQLRKDDSNVAVDKVLRELLGSNAKMSGKIGGTIETRVQDRVLLLDNPATQGGAVDRAKNKAHRSRSKRSSKHLSLRQHRHLGSFNLPIEYQKYELYLPMHEMWKEYVRKLVHNCK
jgi:ribonuclease P protein subunit POP4